MSGALNISHMGLFFSGSNHAGMALTNPILISQFPMPVVRQKKCCNKTQECYLLIGSWIVAPTQQRTRPDNQQYYKQRTNMRTV